MKLTSFLIFIAMVGLVFIMISTFSTDLNNNYVVSGGTNINLTGYDDSEYDFTTSLNSSITEIQNRFEIITDEDRGFFTKLGAGIVAIPYAVVLFPKAVLVGLASAGTMITNFGTTLGLPKNVIYVFIFISIIFVLGLLIKFFQKNEG